MQYSFAALALAAAVSAMPAPQMASGAPADCMASYPGQFEIEVVNTTDSNSKRGLGKRQGPLLLTLQDGVLKDTQGRIGNIVANNQFQFDPAPGQAGAIYTSGWAVCPDGTLVLGKDSVFQQCLSGTFYNLYDENPAAQCNSVHIYVIGASSSGAASQSADGQPVQSQQTDGQVTGTPAANPPVQQITDGQVQAVTQISDGQIQAPAGTPLMQISDGQVQNVQTSGVVSQSSDGQIIATPTSAPVGEISDGQPQVSTQATGAPISQISDGQVQANPTAAPITQISDGQIQAPTGAVSQISDGQVQAPTGAVSQISDGQVQAPTGAPITQISDGQIQAPTGAPVTQISDGQIQAPTGAPVTQISDGQIQAPTNGSVATPTPSVVPYTGAATAVRGSVFGLAAGVLAVALL